MEQYQTPSQQAGSQTITIDSAQQENADLVPTDDTTDNNGSIFLSSASVKDLHKARQRMQQYQREYWMDFAAQRGMSFTSEPGPSDREPEPDPDPEPPMRWDSVIPPNKNPRNSAMRPSQRPQQARAQQTRAPPRRLPSRVPVPQVAPIKLQPLPSDAEDEISDEPIPLPPMPSVPKFQGDVPRRDRLRAYDTKWRRDVLGNMEKRLDL